MGGAGAEWLGSDTQMGAQGGKTLDSHPSINFLRNNRPAGAFDGPMVERLEKLPSSHRPRAFNCAINCLACGDNSLNR
jgi:hypothetical protein